MIFTGVRYLDLIECCIVKTNLHNCVKSSFTGKADHMTLRANEQITPYCIRVSIFTMDLLKMFLFVIICSSLSITYFFVCNTALYHRVEGYGPITIFTNPTG